MEQAQQTKLEAPANPLLIVAMRLLALDDCLAARCVCRAWRDALGTAFCHAVRLPYSVWHEAASSPRLAATISCVAAAFPHAHTLLLDAGGARPVLQPAIWPALGAALNPWLATGQQLGALRTVRLHLHAPPSPQQLQALAALPCLCALQLQHTSLALYSRHLSALAGLTQLQSLALLLVHPRLELRSLGHQRLRRGPLRSDCLSSLQQLTHLEISSTGPTGELLPDTAAAFSSPASLAALSGLRHLGISEAALPGPWPAQEWLQPLSRLTSLRYTQLDEPGKAAARSKGGAAAAAPGGAGGLLSVGGFSAAIAAAAAAGGSRSEQLLLQSVQQQGLLPGLSGLSSVSSSGGGALNLSRASSADGTGAGPSSAHVPPGAPGGGLGSAVASRLGRSSSGSAGSSVDGEAIAASGAGAGAGVAAPSEPPLPPPLPPLDLAAWLPGLRQLSVSNLAGERLTRLRVPPGLTRLTLHLAQPCPGAVSGEQLAAVVLQAAGSLVALELGLGMRFSLSGSVMRSLKRGLKQLRELTLLEGAQDHLEGLGCWCNLPRLCLVEGRCTVPLRGLYELSMRAAMGRTPGALRYSGHVRHVDELASRLGSALAELRLDSLAGLSSCARGALLSTSSGGLAPPLSPPPPPPAAAAAGAAPLAPPRSPLALGRSGSASLSASGSSSPEPCSPPPLAQLCALTRLEVVGERLGQLDGAAGAALGSCQRLVVLHIVAQEPWLAPELGVKEQLHWLAGLTRLRQLRLAGVMLGRRKLAGEPPSAAQPVAGSSRASSSAGGSRNAAAPAKVGSAGCLAAPHAAARGRSGPAGGPACSGSSNSSSDGGPGLMPAVKGLGNGLGCSTAGSRGGAAGAAPPAGPAAAAAALVPAAAPAGAFGLLCDPRVAAVQDLAVAMHLEELRRWLCELLPHARVWLD